MYEKGEIDTTSKQNIKDNGEVFTPFKIVNEMLDLVPKETWKDPTYCFMEPTSGNGQFLVKVLEKRLKHGIPLEVALNTLIGMEINHATILDSHIRLYEIACKQMIKEGVIPGKKTWFNRAMKMTAIIRNNVFQVDDSLKYMKDGRLTEKRFFFEDPTGNNQIISGSKRTQKLEVIKKMFKTHYDGSPTKTLQPFFEKY